MGPSCFFFSYGNPCRSETPSINTRRSDISLSFDRTSAKVLESLLEPNHGESPKRKKMIKKEKKKNGRKSVFFYTCRRSFQVQSCGPAMAPVMLLQRGGMLHGMIFLFISPLSCKGWGCVEVKKSQRKSASPTADGRDFPRKVTGGNKCTFKEMQQRISDADVTACSL